MDERQTLPAAYLTFNPISDRPQATSKATFQAQHNNQNEQTPFTAVPLVIHALTNTLLFLLLSRLDRRPSQARVWVRGCFCFASLRPAPLASIQPEQRRAFPHERALLPPPAPREGGGGGWDNLEHGPAGLQAAAWRARGRTRQE